MEKRTYFCDMCKKEIKGEVFNFYTGYKDRTFVVESKEGDVLDFCEDCVNRIANIIQDFVKADATLSCKDDLTIADSNVDTFDLPPYVEGEEVELPFSEAVTEAVTDDKTKVLTNFTNALKEYETLNKEETDKKEEDIKDKFTNDLITALRNPSDLSNYFKFIRAEL